MPRRAAAFVALLALAGCKEEPDSVPDISIDVGESRVPPVTGPNAFDSYARLAVRAERAATVSLDARDTDGNRRKALAEMGPLLDQLASATRLPCTFRFVPSSPFARRPHHQGWLHLGRALVWKIEKAVSDSEWEPAARWAVVATVFGLDLSGGSVSDSTLGFGVADGARRAIAPYIANLPPSAHAALADGLRAALNRAPDASTTIEHEGLEMVAAVKAIQQAIKDGKLDEFATKLYGRSRDSVRAVGLLDAAERNAFLQSLLDEQKRIVEQLVARSAAPGALRGPVELSLSGNERVLSMQFFTAGGPWMTVRDITLARTRLLYCTAALQHKVASSGAVPSDLTGLSQEHTVDPYTGMTLGYLPLGRDFIVYSYGIDGKDDRGDTNATRTEPDMMIEDAAR